MWVSSLATLLRSSRNWTLSIGYAKLTGDRPEEVKGMDNKSAARITIQPFIGGADEGSTYDKNEFHCQEQFLSKIPPRETPVTQTHFHGDVIPASRVALVGFGTVGRAVSKILCERNDGLLRLTHICNRNFERKKQPWVPSDVVWTEDFQEVLNSDADIVIELIGGLTPAEELVRGALSAGK